MHAIRLQRLRVRDGDDGPDYYLWYPRPRPRPRPCPPPSAFTFIFTYPGTGCDSDYITTCGIEDTMTHTTCGAQMEMADCREQDDCVWCVDASASDVTDAADERDDDTAGSVSEMTESVCVSALDKTCMISGETVGSGICGDDDTGDAAAARAMIQTFHLMIMVCCCGCVATHMRMCMMGKKKKSSVAPSSAPVSVEMAPVAAAEPVQVFVPQVEKSSEGPPGLSFCF